MLAYRHCQNQMQRLQTVVKATPVSGSRGRDPWRLRSTRLHWHIDPRQVRYPVRLREREPWEQTHMKSVGFSTVSEIPAKIAAFHPLALGHPPFFACRLEAGLEHRSSPFSFHPP
jgi:hypothetical protein